jgi:hypothetical protein
MKKQKPEIQDKGRFADHVKNEPSLAQQSPRLAQAADFQIVPDGGQTRGKRDISGQRKPPRKRSPVTVDKYGRHLAN